MGTASINDEMSFLSVSMIVVSGTERQRLKRSSVNIGLIDDMKRKRDPKTSYLNIPDPVEKIISQQAVGTKLRAFEIMLGGKNRGSIQLNFMLAMDTLMPYNLYEQRALHADSNLSSL